MDDITRFIKASKTKRGKCNDDSYFKVSICNLGLTAVTMATNVNYGITVNVKIIPTEF